MPARAPSWQNYALSRRSAPFPSYICPSCARAKLRGARHSYGKVAPPPTRLASTLISSTAVNARKIVPEHLKRLHSAFEALRKNATTFVDLSRLQLALQGLESTAPATRTAILGLSNAQSARQVARLLVADPLEAEGGWEQRISQSEEEEPRALLLRYGAEDDPVPSNPLLNVIHVPSTVLQQNNLEILVATLPTPAITPSPHSSLADSALVPLIGTPSSFTGGVSMVRHPVHRALIVADGLPGCLSLGRWGSDAQETSDPQHAQVKVTLDLPHFPPDSRERSSLGIALLDISKAMQGLSLFRKSSTEHATEYASKWAQSGMPELVSWMKVQRHAQQGSLVPEVGALLRDLLDRATANILKERSREAWPGVASRENGEQIRNLTEAISSWAAASHAELRDRLEEAFDSNEWAMIKWYKLLWRVDDVEMIASNLLERYWLVDAEKRIIWLSGRATEAGLLEADEAMALPKHLESNSEWDSHLQEDAARAPLPSPAGTAILPSASSEIRHEGRPKHSGVEEERNWLRASTLPALQRKAQGLVLQTVSLSAITSGFSMLVYFSWPATGLYGAGAFAALGIMWSLRRLQAQWESARSGWQNELREQGRRVLKASEDGLRGLIASKSQTARHESGSTEGLNLAEEAVTEAQEALEQLQSVKPTRST